MQNRQLVGITRLDMMNAQDVLDAIRQPFNASIKGINVRNVDVTLQLMLELKHKHNIDCTAGHHVTVPGVKTHDVTFHGTEIQSTPDMLPVAIKKYQGKDSKLSWIGWLALTDEWRAAGGMLLTKVDHTSDPEDMIRSHVTTRLAADITYGQAHKDISKWFNVSEQVARLIVQGGTMFTPLPAMNEAIHTAHCDITDAYSYSTHDIHKTHCGDRINIDHVIDMLCILRSQPMLQLRPNTSLPLHKKLVNHLTQITDGTITAWWKKNPNRIPSQVRN